MNNKKINWVLLLTLSMLLGINAPIVYASNVGLEVNQENIDPLKVKVTIEMENASIEDFFKKLKNATSNRVSFVYSPVDLAYIKGITISAKETEIGDLLKDLQKTYPNISYSVERNIITVKKRASQQNVAAVKSTRVSIKGNVVDEKSQPISGATILLLGTTKGAISDNKGIFTMDVDSGQEIEVSYMGMIARVIKVTPLDANITITLRNDLLAIDEVQVVAYGTTTRRGATGSISVVKADEIKGIPSSSVSNLLQGRVAGMDVTNISGAPGGGGTQVTIRGYNSLSMESGRRFSNPLWVIDGVPMNSFTSPVTGTNGLSDLNPETIESIQILKDASATSLYGSRAANGVILVTTKKGYKNQDAQFSVNFSQTFSFLPEYPTVYGGRGERQHRINAYRNSMSAFYDSALGTYRYPTSYEDAYNNRGSYDGFWGDGRSTSNGNELQDSLNTFYNNSTNFFKYYYQTGKITNANVQTFGGSERMTYSIGGGYYGEDGILKGSSFDRMNIMGNFSVQPLKYLTADFRTALTYSDRSKGADKRSGFGRGGDIETVPGDPFKLSSLLPGNNPAMDKVLNSLQSMDEKNNSLRLRSSFGLKLDILKNLTASSTVSIDYSQNTRNLFIPAALSEQNRSSTTGEVSRDMMILNENLLNYNFETNSGHGFEFMVGQSYQYDVYNYIGGMAENGPSDLVKYATDYGWPSLITENNGTVKALKNYQSNFTEKKMASLFGRVNYNYKQRYLFTATIRRDGSSVFGKNVRWATFPSVAVAWNFSEENFMKSLSFLDFGKLRASYGKSGNQFTNPYLAYGILVGSRVYNGNPTISPDWDEGFYNPDLTWEETKQLDLGVDLNLFKNRLTFSADYYHRITDRMLIIAGIPSNYSGYSSVWRNGAALLNEGLEFDVKYSIFNSDKAFWSIGINFSKNWNKFYKSYNGRDLSVSGQNGDPRNYVLGKSVGEIYGFVTDGYLQTDKDIKYYWKEYMSYEPIAENGDSKNFYKPGDHKIKDINGDAKIDYKDQVYLGSSLPTLYGGIISEAKYKNFDLNLLLSYSLGRDMVYTGASRSVATFTTLSPIFENLDNVTFWEKEGDNTDYFLNQAGKSSGVLDKMVQKVNYLKLKTVTLGYTLPRQMSRRIKLSEIRAFVSAENLFTLTNYKGGLDPETVDINTGIDQGISYPLARKFTIGLTVKF